MKSFNPVLFCLFCGLLIGSCQRPLVVDDDQTMPPGAEWMLVDTQADRVVQTLHATSSEWYFLTENQFARFDANDVMLENRPLGANSGVRGIPALSDRSFARLTIDESAQQILGFHLTHNPSEVIEIPADSLKQPGDDLVEIEYFGRSIGVFNDNGTLFMVPAKVFPDRHYVMLLFEVLQNPAHDQFTSVGMVMRINLTSVSADAANIVSMRFLGGNFYVSSREGSWRISPSGQAEEIIPQWMIDFFSWQGKLFATGISNVDLQESSDNGVTWKQANLDSELRFTEIAGDLLLTQMPRGNVFHSISHDFLTVQSIVFPDGISTSQALFYDVTYFGGKYYFSIDNRVYHTTQVLLE